MATLLWMSYSDLQAWATPGLHGSKNGPNWVTWFYSPYLIVSAKDNPVYVRIHDVMVDKVKNFMDHQSKPSR